MIDFKPRKKRDFEIKFIDHSQSDRTRSKSISFTRDTDPNKILKKVGDLLR